MRQLTGPSSTAVGQLDAVRAVGLTLPEVESDTKYDGTPVLKLRGCFLAGLATHASAEPGTLVLRMDEDERALLLEDAPDVYYVTEYYAKYPLVLVRLAHVSDDALRDLLSTSWRLTREKTTRRRTPGRPR